MVNLNFNQCNTGGYYPVPIDTTRSQLLSLFNSQTTTIINPVAVASFAYANFLVPQDVWAGSLLGVRKQAGSGMSITDNLDGSFILNPGTYRIEFSANGVSTVANPLDLALVLDGIVVEESRVTASMPGSAVDVASQSVVTIENSGALLRLVNVANDTSTINRASITISRIG